MHSRRHLSRRNPSGAFCNRKHTNFYYLVNVVPASNLIEINFYCYFETRQSGEYKQNADRTLMHAPVQGNKGYAPRFRWQWRIFMLRCKKPSNVDARRNKEVPDWHARSSHHVIKYRIWSPLSISINVWQLARCSMFIIIVWPPLIWFSPLANSVSHATMCFYIVFRKLDLTRFLWIMMPCLIYAPPGKKSVWSRCPS